MITANVVFIDGFDKYGTTGSGNQAAGTGTGLAVPFLALLANEYTSVTFSVGTATILAPLSSNGQSIQLNTGANTAACTLNKTMGASYTRIVGGMRIRFDQTVSGAQIFMAFKDASGSIAASLAFSTTNQIQLYNSSSVLVNTTPLAPTIGSVHFLEWDIVVGTTGAYTIYVDGAAQITGTGNFKPSTSSVWNNFVLGCSHGTGQPQMIFTVDDLYIGDDTGTPLLTSPVVQTDFPTSDNSVTLANTAAAIGDWDVRTSTTNAPGANELFLRKFVAPAGGCTLNSISTLSSTTSATAKFKAVVYADSGGSPNGQSRLAQATSDTIGCTLAIPITSALSAPLALTGGATYWLGFITDTALAMYLNDANLNGVKAANTYTSGAPATCPTVTTGQNDWVVWGNVTGTTSNAYEVNQNPTPDSYGDYSYVQSSTVGNEDLYNFPSLAVAPAQVHTVAIKGFIRDSDAGARTVTLNMKSGGTDGTGSAAAAQPLTTYGWMSSYFATDPNTSAAWTNTALNAALAGYKIAS